MRAAHIYEKWLIASFNRTFPISQASEERMKYLLLALPLVAAACASDYGPGYTAGYYGTGYYGGYPTYSSRYAYNEGYYQRPYYSGENCGTPDEPKGCPPLPRHPLPYYPGDRY